MGEVLKVALVENELAWVEFMRVKVNLDITKPLLEAKNVNVGVAKSSWILVAYERLPNSIINVAAWATASKNAQRRCII